MYNKIEECIGRTLNSLEYEMLGNLVKDFSINEIVDCFKNYPNKPLKYIIQVLKNKPKAKTTEWMNKEIVNQEIDEESEKEFKDFKKFMEEFRK